MGWGNHVDPCLLLAATCTEEALSEPRDSVWPSCADDVRRGSFAVKIGHQGHTVVLQNHEHLGMRLARANSTCLNPIYMQT